MKKEAENRTQPGAGEQLDSRVMPVMREAVAMVHMIIFAELRRKLAGKYSGWPDAEYRRLIGCLVNDIFGTPALDEKAVSFARANLDLVEKELWEVAAHIPDLLPILTDGLRMQTLCDQQQGINTLPTLLRARALGILQQERIMPMPSTFMLAVRKMAAEHGLVAAGDREQDPSI